jgi:hypothetical protein
MMPLDLSRQHVLRRIHSIFPDPAEAQMALESLDSCGQQDEGTQLAILKVCEGKLWRLRDLVHMAKKDFRDVHFLAQVPELVRFTDENEAIRASGGTPKKLTIEEEKAMHKRDQAQWFKWLSGE